MKKLTEWLLNFGLTTSAVAVIIMGVFTIGPWIETRFFPVYSKFKIVSVEPYGQNQTRAVFEFTKFRQCDPQGFAWFAGELNTPLRQLSVRIEREQGAQVQMRRPLGEQESSPYIINVTPEQIREATFAEIYNRCHPFWLTRSDIYP